MGLMRSFVMVAALASLTGQAVANKKTGKIDVVYRCDGESVKLGLSRDVIVHYVADGKTSVAILPIHNHPVTLTRVAADSGAKYSNGSLTWWEKGDRGTTVSKGAGMGSCRVTEGPRGNYLSPPPVYP